MYNFCMLVKLAKGPIGLFRKLSSNPNTCRFVSLKKSSGIVPVNRLLPRPRNVSAPREPKSSGIVPKIPPYWSSRCFNFDNGVRLCNDEFSTNSILNGRIKSSNRLRNLISFGIDPINWLLAVVFDSKRNIVRKNKVRLHERCQSTRHNNDNDNYWLIKKSIYTIQTVLPTIIFWSGKKYRITYTIQSGRPFDPRCGRH